MSIIIIEFAIQEAPALPTSPVSGSNATIEKVQKALELNKIKIILFKTMLSYI